MTVDALRSWAARRVCKAWICSRIWVLNRAAWSATSAACVVPRVACSSTNLACVAARAACVRGCAAAKAAWHSCRLVKQKYLLGPPLRCERWGGQHQHQHQSKS
jgi:hypothetical protein